MILNGTRFGTIEYTDADVLRFEEGLIGFPSLTGFLLVEHKPGSPFRWLQSVDEPQMALLVTDPTAYVPDYQLSILDHVVLTTATIPPGKPQEMTLNLAGPIVIDATSRTGRQVVLDDGSYTVKHRVFQPESSLGVKAAA